MKNSPQKIFDLVIIGAGPAGISIAVEAIMSGISASKILVIEKATEHSWLIRKFYPEQKVVTANFKGKKAICSGVMCIADLSKKETLTYLDRAIVDNNINVNYLEVVLKITKNSKENFEIETNVSTYISKICVIAIGVFGKPNRPNFSITSELKSKVSFDVTSRELLNSRILVIGGGDSASEYTQYLVQKGNDLVLSYRKDQFVRMNKINRESLLELKKNKKVAIILKSNVKAISSCENNRKIKVLFEESDFNQDSCKELIVDHIVCALGGTTPINFLKVLNIEFIGNEPSIKSSHETSISGLFLIGDLSAGKKGGSIISAFNSSSEAMKNICTHYLDCK